MKQLSMTLTAAAMLALFGCGGNADKHNETAAAPADSAKTEQVAEAPAESAPMDSAAMQKAWEAYSTPGDMHKWMAGMSGKWDAEMTFWMGPDSKPSETSKATSENKMVLGDRYLVSEYKGSMMGMPFNGMETMAYDNAKKKFVVTWIDNTGTGVMYMEGTYDEGSKTLNLNGTMTDPMTGKECKYRQALKMVDDKTQIMEMYDNKTGTEYKSMEIKLTKK